MSIALAAIAFGLFGFASGAAIGSVGRDKPPVQVIDLARAWSVPKPTPRACRKKRALARRELRAALTGRVNQ